MATFKSLVFAAVLAAALSVGMGLGRQRRDLLAFDGLLEAVEQAACYSACEVGNDDDTNDSIFGASCTSGDGSSALKACCAKCGDATSSAGKPGKPCTSSCATMNDGTTLYCVTDEYLASETDGSKFCSCQNRNFRTTDKWSADYDKGEDGPDRRKQTRTVLIVFSSLAFILFVALQFLLHTGRTRGFSTPIYDPYGSILEFQGVVIFLYSVLCGVLGLVFARYGLLEASSITTYSSTYGCLQYNEDDDDDNYYYNNRDFGYGYADAWTGWGIYWFFVHLCLPGIIFGAAWYVDGNTWENTERNPPRQISLNPGMKVRPDQVQWDEAPATCKITDTNWKGGGMEPFSPHGFRRGIHNW